MNGTRLACEDFVDRFHFRRSIDERGWWNLGWAVNGGFEGSLE
jgi:hypothetical protein